MHRQELHLERHESPESERGGISSVLTHSHCAVLAADTVLGGHNKLSNTRSLLFSWMVSPRLEVKGITNHSDYNA